MLRRVPLGLSLIVQERRPKLDFDWQLLPHLPVIECNSKAVCSLWIIKLRVLREPVSNLQIAAEARGGAYYDRANS